MPLLGDAVTASGGVGLERHRGFRGSWVGAAPYPTHPARPSGPPPWPARSCPSKAARRPPARCAGSSWASAPRQARGSRGFPSYELLLGGTLSRCLTCLCRPKSPSRDLPDRQGQRHAPAAVIAIPAYTGSVLGSYARSLLEAIVPTVPPQRQPHRSVQHGPGEPTAGESGSAASARRYLPCPWNCSLRSMRIPSRGFFRCRLRGRNCHRR